MSGTKRSRKLHLPSLKISGFRGINSLSIPRLGHVTLLVGRNGVGKTSVLEAIQVYAARARQNVLQALLSKREEFEDAMEGERDLPARVYDYANLFHGRVADPSSAISIGPVRGKRTLKIVDYPWNKQSEEHRESLINRLNRMNIPENYNLHPLKIMFEKTELVLPGVSMEVHNSPGRWKYAHDESNWLEAVKCVSMGTGLLSEDEAVSYWDNIALTEDEGFCLEALRSVRPEDDYVERIAAIGDPKYSRRMIVKLKGSDSRVPLASLGDGVARMFGVAVSLANSRDGFLLIDEAGNDIHHTQQEEYWRMILESALRGNIQVVATTHSWDCVSGFARAVARSEAEGVFARLERREDKIEVVDYSEEGIGICVERGIEMR